MLSRILCLAMSHSVAAAFMMALSMAVAAVRTSRAEELGVTVHASRALPGYNLITPADHTTYLFDNEGRVVHSWPNAVDNFAYLLDNRHLFVIAAADNLAPRFQGPGKGGRIQELDWDGDVVWDFEYHSEQRQPHHDAIKLPNGNALLICWEMIDEPEAVARGCRPQSVKDSHLQPDCLVEIRPTGRTTGEVVWEWRSWDHLIQDYDKTKPNYGKVADHPERFDANYGENGDEVKSPDWMHVNAVAYNAELDQIALSSPKFNEIWIIDHNTTTEEARGHTGGRWGKGGDILYRWGNPHAYRIGAKIDQRLFFQHNIHWISKGLPGEGHLLVFNNGGGREPEEHSAVDEFVPPIDNAGNYLRRTNAPFGPDAPLWSYTSPNKSDFYSWFISGAQRLPNGNTLINAGAVGVVFEVTPEKELVWKFSNPFPNERPPANAAPQAFHAIPNGVRSRLSPTEEQIKQLDALDNELNAKLDQTLTVEQKKILTGLVDVDVSTVPAGEYLGLFMNPNLGLTEAQTATLTSLAQEYNPKIVATLTEEQRTTIQQRRDEQARKQPRRQLRARNTLFRAMRYAVDHPAFMGKTLSPGKTLIDLAQQREHAQNVQP